MNLEKIKKLEEEKGLKLVELIEQAQAENVKSLRAVKKLMRRCRSQEVREAVLDALPKKPVVEFAARIKDFDRIQIAASLLWMYRQHPDEVNEFLSWLKLPAVGGYDQLKQMMQTWIVEEN
jgi:hypothetical protein